ncbi:hypothetical protein DFH27DRAFT_515735 [Peziza echinospora]|nr:hypothetical protein DFH27DRAFT_515735 [Peziza echinospora]
MSKAKAHAVSEDGVQRNLYVYDLPELLVSTLIPIADPAASKPPEPKPSPTDPLLFPPNPDALPPPTPAIVSTDCTICHVQNRTVHDQRNHVRSDLHKFNIKRRIRAQRAVTEQEFEKMIAEIDENESISGSGGEDSEEGLSEVDEEGGSGAASTTIIKRRGIKPTKHSDAYDTYNDDADAIKGVAKTPVLWFTSSILPSNISVGIYRVLFPLNQTPADLVPFLEKNQLKPSRPTSVPVPLTTSPPHFFLCMIGGGHFAAMVIGLPPVYANQRAGERGATVLAHQTFHRYTTRRKQGGSQSANDASKGKANSAGAQIRRYNESELQREIRELLASWKEKWIDTAELIFVRAAGTGNKRTLFHYDDAVLRLKDERLRGFPFSTRRATQSELMRSFMELTRVKFSSVDPRELRPQVPVDLDSTTTTTTGTTSSAAAAAAAAAAKPKPHKKPTKEEKQLVDDTATLVSLMRRTKIPPLITYMTTHALSPDFPLHPPEAYRHTPTPLHFAASINSPAIVGVLLTRMGADPTTRNEEGRTAFELAGDRATRDSFRVARGEVGEERWDWEGARVPGALTAEEAGKRSEGAERERKVEEERERERRAREAQRLKSEEEAAGKKALASGGKQVLLASGTRLRTGEDLGREREVAGMTPEARMRLERERRARAAEERFRKMQL